MSSLEHITGNWEGAIQIPSQPLQIMIKFTKEGGTISIPVQGLEEYPLTSVELNKSDLPGFNCKRQSRPSSSSH